MACSPAGSPRSPPPGEIALLRRRARRLTQRDQAAEIGGGHPQLAARPQHPPAFLEQPQAPVERKVLDEVLVEDVIPGGVGEGQRRRDVDVHLPRRARIEIGVQPARQVVGSAAEVELPHRMRAQVGRDRTLPLERELEREHAIEHALRRGEHVTRGDPHDAHGSREAIRMRRHGGHITATRARSHLARGARPERVGHWRGLLAGAIAEGAEPRGPLPKIGLRPPRPRILPKPPPRRILARVPRWTRFDVTSGVTPAAFYCLER